MIDQVDVSSGDRTEYERTDLDIPSSIDLLNDQFLFGRADEELLDHVDDLQDVGSQQESLRQGESKNQSEEEVNRILTI